jgi:hypothetical protein
MKTERVVAVITAAVLLAAFFLIVRSFTGSGAEPTGSDRTSPQTPVSSVHAPRASNAIDADRRAPLSDDERTSAQRLAFPERSTIRCETGGSIDDGAYSARGLEMVVARDGTLGASVSRAKGSAVLHLNLQPVAMVTWKGATLRTVGTCTVDRAVWLDGAGRVIDAAGAGVANALVRGCDHGELSRTDADGAFTYRIMRGSTCHPMAFVEHDDGRLTKGGYEEITTEGDQAPELILTMPAEDTLSEEQLRAQALQLADMTQMMLDRHKQGQANVQRVLESNAGSPEDRGVLTQWLDADDEVLDRMAEQIEMLRDPDEQLDALKDAWLNQY